MYLQKTLSIKLLSDDSFQMLLTAKCQDRVDTGFEAYNYNVLTNPNYQKMFELAPVKTRFFDQ